MKNIALLTASLLLIGAGCAVGQQPEFQEQAPPAAQPAQPATPPDEPNQEAQPATPAVPPSDNSEEETGTSAQLKAEVVISAGGSFVPATLTVKQGTTVTWRNTGNASVWPASDPHPTHSIYPGFDAGRPVGGGGSWSFTFDKKGSWGYHNHLNPYVGGGTVIVE